MESTFPIVAPIGKPLTEPPLLVIAAYSRLIPSGVLAVVQDIAPVHFAPLRHMSVVAKLCPMRTCCYSLMLSVVIRADQSHNCILLLA
jgi:hypothetical protein